MKKEFKVVTLLLIMFSIPLISSSSFGYNSLDLPRVESSLIDADLLGGFSSSDFMKILGGNNANGTQNFNGGWENGGSSLIGGDIYAQTLFVYNITALVINSIHINGTFLPSVDNSFDIGSTLLRWKDLYLSGDADIQGSLNVDGNVTANYGFFDFLGALDNPIQNIFSNEITMSGNINMNNGNISNVLKTIYNISGCTDEDFGTFCYDATYDTMRFVTESGQILQMNQETTAQVKNLEGTNVADGSIIYLMGATGDNSNFKLAQADNLSTSGLLGVVTKDCANNQVCPGVFFGVIHGIDTTDFSSGDHLYLSAIEEGNFTTTPPEFPNVPIWVATALRIHATEGTIFVFPRLDSANGITMNNLGLVGDFIQTDYKIMSLPGNDAIGQNVFTIQMNGTTGIDIPHLVLQPGGTGQASTWVRSGIVVPESIFCLNSTNRTEPLCFETVGGFTWDILDFNTNLTEGADWGITGELEVIKDANIHGSLNATDIFSTHINNSGIAFFEDRLIVGEPCDVSNTIPGSICASGQIFANNTIITFAGNNGAGFNSRKSLTESPLVKRLGFTGDFNSSESLFCDSTNPFTTNDTFNSLSILSASPTSMNGVQGQIISFINSSCIIWEPEVPVSFNVVDISSIIYITSDVGMILTSDSGQFLSVIDGKNAQRKVDFTDTSTNNYNINLIGSEKDQFLFQSNAQIEGNIGFTNARFFIESNEDVNDTITHGVISEIDLSNFNGGEVHIFEASILNPDGIETTGLAVDSKITNIVKSLKSENVSKAWLNDSSTLTDLTNDINDDSISTSIFPNNGSILYMSNGINFTETSFILDVQSNEDVDLVGFYCNSSGWFDLDISDGTNGMQKTGSISFLTPETRGTCNFQTNGNIFLGGENLTYIAFQRTNPSVAITPNTTLVELIIDSSLIRIGNVEGGSGAENAFTFVNEELLDPGEPHTQFDYTDSQGNKRTGVWFTSRANETASGNSNSFIIAPDNDLSDRLDMTETSNAVQRIENYYGETSPVDFDSSQNRTSLFVLFAGVMQQLYLSNGLDNGLLSVFGDANFFIRDGEEFDVVGDVHIQKTTIVPTGFLPGDTVVLDPPTTNFEDGVLSPFVQISTGGGASEWTVVSDANCPDGSCARAVGGALSPPRIMEVNFTTIPFDNLNLTFNLTTINLDALDLFNVTINNNSGSGEQQIFAIDDGSNVVNAKINPVIPTNMNNASVVSLRYYLTANVLNEFAYVDLVLLTGNATADTTANVSRGDANIRLGFEEDGFTYEGNEVTGRSTLNITADNVNFIGNTTFASVTETTLNVTDSINVVNNITAGDKYVLGNGASIGFNTTCYFIFYDPSGNEISNMGCV